MSPSPAAISCLEDIKGKGKVSPHLVVEGVVVIGPQLRHEAVQRCVGQPHRVSCGVHGGGEAELNEKKNLMKKKMYEKIIYQYFFSFP